MATLSTSQVKPKWRKTADTSSGVSGSMPRPRHGHKCVSIKELIIVFGGGNEGIVDELHVFNTAQNAWFVPQCKGETAPGCAAFGFAVENTRLLVHGGMIEYGKYSGDLYELQATKWEWKKLRPKPPRNGPPPCPRLGHSFTLVGKKIYLFGGLCNAAPDPKSHTARYLNDLYVLDISKNPHQWEIPETTGTPPGPRESHTAVLWKKNEGTPEQKEFLVLYGGMMGSRLGDLWMLDLESMAWQKPIVSGVPPVPRSLHTAVIGAGNKMFIFGGWIRDERAKSNENVADTEKDLSVLQKEWMCTNSLGAFDLEKLHWDSYKYDEGEAAPEPRAGHCAAIVHNRMYVWSGRDGYKKSVDAQVCCPDMWFLETAKPAAPGKVQLLRASTNSLDVHWVTTLTADTYHLQIQVYESPPASNPAAAAALAAAKAAAAPGAKQPTVLTVPAGAAVKNAPTGAQVVTLMKPGALQLTPGPAVPATTATPTKPSATPSGALKLPKQPVLVVPEAKAAGPAGQDVKDGTTGENEGAKSDTPEGDDAGPAVKEPVAISGAMKEEAREKSADEPAAAATATATAPATAAATATATAPATTTATAAATATVAATAESGSAVAATEKPATVAETKEKPKEVDQTTKQWYTVGYFTDGNAPVANYYVPLVDDDAKPEALLAAATSVLPAGVTKHLLLPGTAYKFRVAGINMCGRGPWSEMSAFKTCLPGFPGAPSNIKITKCPEGALLTWEPPTNHGDNISEYAVYLATKPTNAKPEISIPTNQLSFVKVYDNPIPTCTITHDNLRYAYYDTNGQKPAIIFRIAAKNEKGYGPATQVRWLQDTMPAGQAR
ncbi:Host cell factor 1 [Hypsibius exemplaris]|uniref:Host cell factor 1 n=1 Tax=Hypsibius exemplaris TaxID=2072580 RepID=A0A1W0WT40_HYPEX|nr:Host cell factor 1 [Hypsibius exemplaris]